MKRSHKKLLEQDSKYYVAMYTRWKKGLLEDEGEFISSALSLQNTLKEIFVDNS